MDDVPVHWDIELVGNDYILTANRQYILLLKGDGTVFRYQFNGDRAGVKQDDEDRVITVN